MSESTVVEVPICEECATELHRAGRGSPRYWVCRYCGTATPVVD